MSSWVDKYRPTEFDDVQGNNQAIKKIRKWAENWSTGDPPQLLVGPPGVGKTTTAEIVSEQLGYPINQINASSARRGEDIKGIVRSMRSSPVDAEHQLILLDEVDSWHHSVDKTALYDALREPSNPVMLTANEEYEVPDSIKRSSTTHKFKLSKPSRKAKIREIAEKEDLDLDKQDLDTLADRPGLRSAINDLQTWAETDMPPGKDHRTWEGSEFDAIEKLLSGDDRAWEDALSVSTDTFRDPGSAILWADENLSEEWRGLEGGVGYDVLSRADRQVQRGHDLTKSTDFRYWKYAAALVEMVPETRLTSPYQGYIDVSFPEWFRSTSESHDDESGEAKLFRALKGEREFRMPGSFFEFQSRLLPILRGLPEEDRMDIALSHNLDESAVEALGLDVDDFDDWQYIEEPEEGDGWSPDTKAAGEASW